MLIKVAENSTGRWLDLKSPNREDIETVVNDYELPETVVYDCLDTSHPPKIEVIDETVFMIARSLDPEPPSDTIDDVTLTRKIAIFIHENNLVTIHRKELNYMDGLRTKWATKCQQPTVEIVPKLLNDILKSVTFSYDSVLEEIEKQIALYEEQIFAGQGGSQMLESIYYLKRKLDIYKRVLRQNLDVIYKFDDYSEQWQYLYHDLREEASRSYHFAEHLLENLNNLFNVHMSLETQRTNDVIKVLTVFSVFFMPLTFIVGVYGMNFKVMPEIEWQYGYPMVWVLMLSVCAALYFWFRRKGWVK